MPPIASLNHRYHPYEEAGNGRSTPALSRSSVDENRSPNNENLHLSSSPFTTQSLNVEGPRVGSGLRHWSSGSTTSIGGSYSTGINDSIFSDERHAIPDPSRSKADRLLEQHDLWDHKDQVYHFVELPAHDREVVLYAHILKLQSDLSAQSQSFDKFRTQVFELTKYVSGNWVPSKVQEALLSQLIGHWLIKPLSTYDKIYERVKTFVHLRAEWLHLGVYITDPVARFAVDKFLMKVAAEMKGTFRKEIMASIKESKPLDAFARGMIEKYHCPVQPKEPPRDILAALVFLRSLAAEFKAVSTQAAPNDTTVATKYWRRVESALTDLYKPQKNGEERATDPRWKFWEDTVINADRMKYNGGAGTTDATLREALAGSSSTQGPSASTSAQSGAAGPSSAGSSMDAAPMFSLYGASAMPVDIPSYAMDSNVELHTLGDVASAIEKNL
uniref:N/A n=1 Tax=Ganoderma boninense TaxID=34458 RepID=A0A5K1JXZ2_9APHY|nr:N/A [Ganoderma boninense]